MVHKNPPRLETPLIHGWQLPEYLGDSREGLRVPAYLHVYKFLPFASGVLTFLHKIRSISLGVINRSLTFSERANELIAFYFMR